MMNAKPSELRSSHMIPLKTIFTFALQIVSIGQSQTCRHLTESMSYQEAIAEKRLDLNGLLHCDENSK